MDLILFLLFAVIAVGCGVNLVIQTHPISSALSLIGVMGSLAGFVFLAAIPWIDRNPSRKPRKRLFAIAASIMLLAGVVVLTIVGLMD